MYFWNHSFPSPEENVAWDEALVEIADRASLVEGDSSSCSELEAMRVWQFDAPTVVIGRGSRVNDEVYLERCLEDGVPVLRRASGGSTIIAGPGCLMYSVLISYQKRPAWRGLDVAHEGVMSKVAMATQKALNAEVFRKCASMQTQHDALPWYDPDIDAARLDRSLFA